MEGSLLQAVKGTVNGSLSLIGLKLSRTDGHDWSDSANFIPFGATREAARKAGLSVGDYVDSVMNGVPGSSRATIDKLAALGVFDRPLDRVVEIGPGTGRYLEKTIAVCKIENYEIYETAQEWASYLVEAHAVTLRPTGGYAMSATSTGAVDLVHAHKVFNSVPFMVTCCYWHEMARVIRPGGWAAFDVMTERCLGGDMLRTWAESGVRNGAYPAVMPREVAVAFFQRHGFSLAGAFQVPCPPGTTELFVFRRGAPS